MSLTAGEGGHACLLTSAGGVQCWGYNRDAELGDGSMMHSTCNGYDCALGPGPVAGLGSGASAVAAGSNHVCAVTASGGVKCWGFGGSGQLGTGSQAQPLCLGGEACATTPVDVQGFGGSGTIAKAVAAGGQNSCALTAGGGVWCWGQNYSGQLGDGLMVHSSCGGEDCSLVPVAVSGLASGVAAISVGGGHACALTTGGGVKCWGDNTYGALGDGTTTNRWAPVDVSGLTSGVVAIAAGGAHTCAVTTSGGVLCWGSNGDGELGVGSQSHSSCSGEDCSLLPLPVPSLPSGVTTVAAGDSDTCVLTTGGGVKCWGWNGYGCELGDGMVTHSHCGGEDCSLVPVDVSGLASGAVALAVGLYANCAATSAGKVECWGSNFVGSVGDGLQTDAFVPTEVVGF